MTSSGEDKRRNNAHDNRNVAHAQGGKCYLCGAEFPMDPADPMSFAKNSFHADHRVPRAQFDRPDLYPLLRKLRKYRDRPYNLGALCPRCNLDKGASMPPATDPSYIHFVLHAIAEEWFESWLAGGGECDPEYSAFWDLHPGEERDAAREFLKTRQRNWIRELVGRTFSQLTVNHYIDKRILYSSAMDDLLDAYGTDAEFCVSAVRELVNLFGQGENLPSFYHSFVRSDGSVYEGGEAKFFKAFHIACEAVRRVERIGLKEGIAIRRDMLMERTA